jgi:hypothetical protein
MAAQVGRIFAFPPHERPRAPICFCGEYYEGFCGASPLDDERITCPQFLIDAAIHLNERATMTYRAGVLGNIRTIPQEDQDILRN